MDLYNENDSKKYYEDSYKRDYMDEHEDVTKKRIIEVIKSLNLPDEGSALDFGCGAGVLTDVIREALPGYIIYGTDISENAINKARKYYNKCIFFNKSEHFIYNKIKFDFLFTNHVLEHVYDINEIAREIVSFLKPCSSMLHILPCGNENSFEKNICSLVKNGIDNQKFGRFFFEDRGHVRRLTTEQLNCIFSKYNYNLHNEYYKNQYYGTINWMTKNNNPITTIKILNPLSCKDIISGMKLFNILIKIFLINALRTPMNIKRYIEAKRLKNYKLYILYTICLLFYPISKPVDKYIRANASNEWNNHKKEKNGSEMYLFFKRGDAVPQK